MDKLIQKTNNMFVEKLALKKALESLITKQNNEIGVELDFIFEDLEKVLLLEDFNICIYRHFDEMRASVYDNAGDNKTQSLEITNYKITSIVGEKDENFTKVIEIVEDFLNKLDTGE